MIRSKIPPKTWKLLILAILLLGNNPAVAQAIQTNPDSIPFAPVVNYVADDGPTSVFCADLDGDNDQDLAMANEWSDHVSILKNNGEGTFQTKVDYEAGSYSFSVFCADLDGDNDQDLAVAGGARNVSILKNNGDGTFQTKVEYGAGDCPISVFCADLDGDNDQDLAVANNGSDNVSILKNNGDGTFQSAVNYETGGGPFSVFCADLDGDGDLDIAIANRNSDNVSILKNLTIETNVQDESEVREKYDIFHLSQNYPNPFNQITKIEFNLARSGFVSLTIYDILGRNVRTLVSEHLSPGYKSVLWNGKNDAGKEVASGIYFYQLKTKDFTETKKLVLLK